MRWDNLGESPAALFGTDVVSRTFDTPEFRGITFHEVRARSIVNRVPGASRMPFEWTVNPYRGCSHACVYCFARKTHGMCRNRLRQLGLQSEREYRVVRRGKSAPRIYSRGASHVSAPSRLPSRRRQGG